MDLKKILSRTEPIAGIEIRETAIRLAILQRNQKKQNPQIIYLGEETLEPGVVANGKILKTVEFKKALASLKSKCPVKFEYAIVSISPENLYLKNLKFPGNIRGSMLAESVDLAIKFQLPFDPKDHYVDFQPSAEGAASEVMIVAIPKNIVNDCIAILTSVHIYPIAIETFPLSFSRSADFSGFGEKPVVVKFQNGSILSFYVLSEKRIAFER